MDHFRTVLLYSKVTVRSKKGESGKFNLSGKKRKKKNTTFVEHAFQGRENFQRERKGSR